MEDRCWICKGTILQQSRRCIFFDPHHKSIFNARSFRRRVSVTTYILYWLLKGGRRCSGIAFLLRFSICSRHLNRSPVGASPVQQLDPTSIHRHHQPRNNHHRRRCRPMRNRHHRRRRLMVRRTMTKVSAQTEHRSWTMVPPVRHNWWQGD